MPLIARKCLACGARSDWQRFLDIGNTSVSLLIAAISVFALGGEHLLKLVERFDDPEEAQITFRISDITIDRITLFVDNDGPGAAVLPTQLSCSVDVIHDIEKIMYGRAADTLRAPQPEASSTGTPELSKSQIPALTVIYAVDEPSILKPGTHMFKQFTSGEAIFGRSEVVLSDQMDAKDGKCWLSYHHENNRQTHTFIRLSDSQVSQFSLSLWHLQREANPAKKIRMPDGTISSPDPSDTLENTP
ncbi:MAG: hypothetical protein Alpg2KO_00630 [Alphaproteobacteria bacterium]